MNRLLISSHMHLARLERLCRRAARLMQVDLNGIRVLTEAATGPFAATAAVAALAGAEEVVAVSRASRWSEARQAFFEVSELVERLGVSTKVTYKEGEASLFARDCDLVTNLGYVRPLNRDMARVLSSNAVVSLMWEPWEFREGDVDLKAFSDFEIPIIATNEQHPHVRTFDYLGPTVGRLLLDVGIELVNSNLVVIGSDPFGKEVATWLSYAGAVVERTQVSAIESKLMENLDAIVLVEHRDHRPVITSDDREFLVTLGRGGVPIVRMCGVLDMEFVNSCGVLLHPQHEALPGVMSVTTAYAGAKPVVDLHTAGLKAGQLVVKARQDGATLREALNVSVASGYGLRLSVSE